MTAELCLTNSGTLTAAHKAINSKPHSFAYQETSGMTLNTERRWALQLDTSSALRPRLAWCNVQTNLLPSSQPFPLFQAFPSLPPKHASQLRASSRKVFNALLLNNNSRTPHQPRTPGQDCKGSPMRLALSSALDNSLSKLLALSH